MKKRRDCVFGLHFDFHAKEDETNLGDNFRIEDYETILREVRPDCIQVDTKGHPGIASYPTKIGNAAKGLHGDMLKSIGALCKKYDTPVYSHYSGVWDIAASKNEKYAAVFKDVEYRGETSVFSDYAEDIFIPQMKELASEYGMNGIWVDGECWATQVDVSEHALRAYRKKYGEEPDVESEKYREFCRQGFYDYLSKYVNAVHAEFPDYEIASNWLETSFCPRDTGISVDFISGDYDPVDSLNTARFESRVLCGCKKHWELLSWGFNTQNGVYQNKSVNQLKQELSAIYNLGGAASLYYTSKRNNVQANMVGCWKELKAFSEHTGVPNKGFSLLPEIAVLYSEKGLFAQGKRLFSRWERPIADGVMGLVLALSDAGYNADVVFSDAIVLRAPKYSLVVVPNWQTLEEEVRDALVSYVKEGGRLLLAGESAVLNFKDTFGLRDEGMTADPLFIDWAPTAIGVSGNKLKLQGGGVAFLSDYLDGKAVSSAYVVQRFGKGSVAAIPFDLGAFYRNNQSDYLLEFLKSVVSGVGFVPIVEAAGHHKLDVAAGTVGGVFTINLLSTLGAHNNEKVREYEYIPPLTDVVLTIHTDLLPKALRLDPAGATAVDQYGKTYACRADGRRIIIEIDRIDIQLTIRIANCK